MSQAPPAAAWHIRKSPRSALMKLAPGACAQPTFTSPVPRRALQVPQVPVAHS
jgi:hypothetical protein